MPKSVGCHDHSADISNTAAVFLAEVMDLPLPFC